MKANNQLQLVTFEQALKLRNAGFDWLCPDVFEDGKTVTHEGEYSRPAILRPAVVLALMWMREVKNIVGVVTVTDDGQYSWEVIFISEDGSVGGSGGATASYSSYKQAESALLDGLF